MGIIQKIDSRYKLRAKLEDYVLTRPSLFFTPVFDASARSAEVKDAVASLQRTGAYFPPQTILTEEQLAALQQTAEDYFSGRKRDLKISENPACGTQIIWNGMHADRVLVDIATNPFTCAVIERVFRRRIYLSDFEFRRTPPISMDEIDERLRRSGLPGTSSEWHRDKRGRQIKVMIYLSDVGPDDSNFAFIPQSHLGYLSRSVSYAETRIDEAWVKDNGVSPVECFGPAGTTLIFDTNVVHRVRRKKTAAIRDSIVFYYTPGQALRELGSASLPISHLAPHARRIFDGRNRMQI